MTTTTTTTKTTIRVRMSERAPFTIAKEDWRVVARADWHDGKVECQANNVRLIRVREHRDGRRLVYGYQKAGDGGQHAGTRNPHAGFLVPPAPRDAMRQPSDGGPLVSTWPDDEETVRAIRRVAGVIGDDDMAEECIADLPAEELA